MSCYRQQHIGSIGTTAAAAIAVADPARLDRHRARGAARGQHANGSQRRRTAARPGLPGPRVAWRDRWLSTRSRRHAATAPARRRGGDRGRGRARDGSGRRGSRHRGDLAACPRQAPAGDAGAAPAQGRCAPDLHRAGPTGRARADHRLRRVDPARCGLPGPRHAPIRVPGPRARCLTAPGRALSAGELGLALVPGGLGHRPTGLADLPSSTRRPR